MRGLSLVVASGGHASSRCAGLSLSRPLLLRSTGSRRAGSVAVAHGPSRSAACGILPDQGLNPCPLHWQVDSQPLHHQGSPKNKLFNIAHVDTIIIANKEVPHTFTSFDPFHFSPFNWGYFIMYQYIDLKWNSNSLPWPIRLRMIFTLVCFIISSHSTCFLSHTAFSSVVKLSKLFSTSGLCTFSFSHRKGTSSALYTADSFSSFWSQVNVMSPETSLTTNHYIQRRFPLLTLALIRPDPHLNHRTQWFCTHFSQGLCITCTIPLAWERR